MENSNSNSNNRSINQVKNLGNSTSRESRKTDENKIKNGDNNYNNYKQKQTIFLDVDDVVFNSSEVVVNILNKRYNQDKTTENVKDWCYKSLNCKMTPKKVEEIFESEEFWSQVKVKDEFIENIASVKELREGYNWAFVTQGSQGNLLKKVEFFLNQPEEHSECLGKAKFYGIGLNERKDTVNMCNGIQVDDNYRNLTTTNASLKILIKNNRETRYNNYDHQAEMANREDLYIINTFEELRDILVFNLMNREDNFF